MENEQKPQTIFFLHMPKTAGTTIHHIIQKQYTKSEMYTADLWFEEEIETFRHLAPKQKAALKIVWGHFSFGLHQFLPQNSTYFTFLRHPVDRVLSHYFYHLRRSDLFGLSDMMEEENLTMHQIFEQGRIIDIHNMYTRLLAGLPYLFPSDAYTVEHLELAKQNLRNHFSIVGLVEHFDASLLLLKQSFGWGNTYYIQHNTTPNRPDVENIPAETIALIKEREKWDMELYVYAQKLFNQQLAQQSVSFSFRIKMFKFSNKVLFGTKEKIIQSDTYIRARHNLTRLRNKMPILRRS